MKNKIYKYPMKLILSIKIFIMLWSKIWCTSYFVPMQCNSLNHKYYTSVMYVSNFVFVDKALKLCLIFVQCRSDTP